MDKLTGSGNILNDGNRVNSVERAKNRLEGVNVDEKRKEAERKINSGH
jgi:conjugal transfer mating pair stabilization protein TraN